MNSSKQVSYGNLPKPKPTREEIWFRFLVLFCSFTSLLNQITTGLKDCSSRKKKCFCFSRVSGCVCERERERRREWERFSEGSFHKSEPSWPNKVSLTLNKTKMGHVWVNFWLGLGTCTSNANEPKIQSKWNFHHHRLFPVFDRFSFLFFCG